MRKTLVTSTVFTCALALTACGPSVSADPAEFPGDEPIELLIGWGAGGQVDIAARTMEPILEDKLGTDIVIINKPGANTQLAMSELTNADPDGHTLGLAYEPQVLWTMLDPEAGAQYKAEDFAHIALVQSTGPALVVNADGPYKTLDDLFSAAKQSPGAIKYGTTGPLSIGNALAIRLKEEQGIDLKAVPFPDGPSLSNALLGGHIDVALINAASAAPQIEAGKWRALAVAGERENPQLPDVKPLVDQGVDIAMENSFGFVAPAGTPDGIIDKVAAAVKSTVQDKELQSKLEALGNEMTYMGPEEYEAYWKELTPDAEKLIEGLRGETK